MLVFHIATAADWRAARRSGAYTTSTRGRTLEQEGFIHASRADQVDDVRRRYYADVDEALVLLTIDTDRLTVPWQEDPVGEDTFPHLYGPLSPSAVVRVQPLDREGRSTTFGQHLFREMGLRIGLALVAMALAVLGSRLGRAVDDDWGALVGALVGLAVGLVVMLVILRRRR